MDISPSVLHVRPAAFPTHAVMCSIQGKGHQISHPFRQAVPGQTLLLLGLLFLAAISLEPVEMTAPMQGHWSVAALMALQQFPQMKTPTTFTDQRPASPSRALWTGRCPNVDQAATSRYLLDVVERLSVMNLESIPPSSMTRCSCYRNVGAQKTL